MLQTIFHSTSASPSGDPLEQNPGLCVDLVSNFNRRRMKGLIQRALHRMGFSSDHLQDLDTAIQGKKVRSRRYLGLCSIQMDQIRGSEGRSRDFDRNFNPVQERSRARWIRIAAARLCGQAMPPVELIQVGASYFVCDGHHRISVARAFGEKYMDAIVTQLEVEKD